MMDWIWVGLVVLSLVFGLVNGRLEAVSASALEGAEAAVQLCLSLCPAICLWSGVLKLLETGGLSAALGKLLRRPLTRLYPEARQDPALLAALAENMSANLLGLGNAATPLGLEAAKRMSEKTPGTAGDSLCMLVVCNTASIQLIPTTVAAVRLAAGCRTPFDILPAVWVTSACSVTVGILAAKTMAMLWRDRP